MCKSMELFRKPNDFEISRSRWGGLQRDIFVPTWRFFALGSHDWTSKILFLGVRWHPPDIFCEGVFCQKVITHPVICDLQNIACNTRHQRNAGSTRGWGRPTRGWTTQRPAGSPIDVVSWCWWFWWLFIRVLVLKIILCNPVLPFFSDLLGDEEGAAISKPCFSPLVRMATTS